MVAKPNTQRSNSNEPGESSVFPMSVTAMEQFFLMDHRDDYPNQIVCRLRFSGRLDQDAVRAAALSIMSRHDMLTARFNGRHRSPKWIEGDQTRIPLTWVDSENLEPYFPPIKNVHPESDSGSRITVVQRPNGSEVILQTHHSCTDGVGGLQVVSDWMIAYANTLAANSASEIKNVKQRKLVPAALHRRGRYYDSWRAAFRNLPYQMIGLLGALKYLSRRAEPLLGKHAAPSDANDAIAREPNDTPSEDTPNQNTQCEGATRDPDLYQPKAITDRLSQEESDWLRIAAQQRQVTVNALLVRELFLAIEDWRRQNKIEVGNGVTRIMIPMNMRSIADRRLGATNRFAITYLDRTRKQLEKPAELLWGINHEVRIIQNLNLGVTCLGMVSLFKWIPGLMRREANAKVCRSTCLLTNLGEPFSRLPLPQRDGKLQVGPLQLEGADLLAPIRPLTACAVSVFRYNNQTQLTLHYDANVLTRDQASSLLEKLLSRARESARRGNRHHKAAQQSESAENDQSV